MKKYSIPQMKLGTTSFIVPENYVGGFRYAAERCDDVSLLLVALGKDREYLISAADVREVRDIADGEGVTVNIHLPADHDFDTPAGARGMVEDVARVIDRTAILDPHAFVLHINFPAFENLLLGANPRGLRVTETQSAFIHEALRDMASMLPGPEYLAIENLETFPPTLWDEWLDGTPYSRCIDVGHFWKDGWDPALFLDSWLPRTRIIHFHGMESRLGKPVPETVAARTLPMVGLRKELADKFSMWPKDHKSLKYMPDECVDTVMHTLWRSGYDKVLNLEMFHIDDFTASHAVIMRSWERYEAQGASHA